MAIKKKRLFGFSILLLSLLLGLIFYRTLSFIPIPPRSHLPTQTEIHDAIRIIVEPLHTSPESPIFFRVTVESTEHPEWLDADIKESSILYFDNNSPVLASKWLIEHETEYSRQGTLIFPAQKEIKDINLSLFLSSEFKFSW